MSKLFVAVDLPSTVADALLRIQPSPRAGLRVAARDQMHLTLHYLGEADLERTASALVSMKSAAFILSFEGVGHFESADGSATLWAGVKPTRDLLALHSAVAAALAPQGFHPESRPYVPHVTLARCAPGVPIHSLAQKLEDDRPFEVNSYSIYSSERVGDHPRYASQRTFALS